jgi:hypothetical protein
MKTCKVLALALLTLGLAAATAVAVLKADDKPKYTIKEVMKKAHDGDATLKDKVISGKASKDEKQLLLDLYTALSLNKAPKGDEKDWKDRTTAIVVAAKDVVDDKDGAVDKLKMAVSCKACHMLYKGK